jgi:hypothetical protein
VTGGASVVYRGVSGIHHGRSRIGGRFSANLVVLRGVCRLSLKAPAGCMLSSQVVYGGV